MIYVQGILGAESRAETRGERRWESKAERRQRREKSERAGRDELQRGSAGRVESKAPAETKRFLKERFKAIEKTTSNDRLKLDLVRRALVYRESATAVVVSHVSTSTPTGAVRRAHLRF